MSGKRKGWRIDSREPLREGYEMTRTTLETAGALAAALCMTIVLGAQSKRATIMMVSGEVVEGAFVSADTTTVVVEIAGRPFPIKQDEVQYISFTGKISESANPASPTMPADPMAKALAALGALNSAVEVGVLREQYSQKLVENVPPVLEFTRSGTEWANVKRAMTLAVANYQYPMADISNWKYGATSMSEGHRWAEYAAILGKDSAQRTRHEDPNATTLNAAGERTGFLGVGDRQMPKDLDGSSEGGFNDVYEFELTSQRRFSVSMSCNPCRPHVTLADGAGKRITADAGGDASPAKIERVLKPGKYQIWVGSFAGQVGEYTASLAFYRQPAAPDSLSRTRGPLSPEPCASCTPGHWISMRKRLLAAYRYNS